VTDLSGLHDYQLEGVEFLASRKRALLADDPGSGKTVQALKAAHKIGARRLLILCPAIGSVSWPIEIQRWQDGAARSSVTILWNRETNALGVPPGPVNLIVTFDQLVHHRDRLLFSMKRSEPFDVCIIDECQYLKTRTARRTKYTYGAHLDITKPSALLSHLKPDAPIWIMSGTPWPNNFSEFYTHANAILPEVVQSLFHVERVSFGQWLMALCEIKKSRYGDKPGSTKKSARPAIRSSLKGIMLRRRKRDVLKELKAPQHFDEPIGQSVSAEWDEDMRTLLQDAGWNGEDDHESLIGALKFLASATESNSTQRRVLGESKADQASDWIDARMQSIAPGEKLIVFAWHTSVIDRLHERLKKYNPAKVTGATPVPERAREAERFQTDPTCRVFIGQTVAAGTSITLTKGNTVVMVEPDWVPSNNEQAISRADRKGQTRDVFVYWLSSPGTLDRKITSALRAKTQDIAETIGDIPHD
jgi:SNF2 family DNA or RNA helicase